MNFRVFFFSLFLIFLSISLVSSADTVLVYKNEACGHCNTYLMELREFLNDQGITDFQQKNMINDFDARIELDEFNKNFEIPPHIQSHLVTIINDNLVLGGHVPISLLEGYFSQYPNHDFPKLVIYQDSMADISDLKSYKILYRDKIKECSIKTPIEECLESNEKSIMSGFLPLVVVSSGVVAGFHPCTIAVLLFFIAFLFTIKKTRKMILSVGGMYILGIFLAYFFIGLGVLKAIVLFDSPHFTAKIGAALVIFLGLINIKDYFWYGRWFSLKIPSASKETISSYIYKATVPSAFIVGLIVGVCSFGCTAGIYFSIISLLTVKATYLQGLIYLIIYNLMFILPLIIILIVASNERIVGKIEELENKQKKRVKLVSGIIMILIGFFILYGVFS